MNTQRTQFLPKCAAFFLSRIFASLNIFFANAQPIIIDKCSGWFWCMCGSIVISALCSIHNITRQKSLTFLLFAVVRSRSFVGGYVEYYNMQCISHNQNTIYFRLSWQFSDRLTRFINMYLPEMKQQQKKEDRTKCWHCSVRSCCRWICRWWQRRRLSVYKIVRHFSQTIINSLGNNKLP